MTDLESPGQMSSAIGWITVSVVVCCAPKLPQFGTFALAAAHGLRT